MKTYCISDVHGHIANLKRFIKTLDEDDVVYVLGDVVDKGVDSIGCLELIMEDKRFRMLLGNHEHMMFQVLSLDKNSSDYYLIYTQWIDWNLGEDTYLSFLKLPKYKQIRIFYYLRDLPLNYPSVKVNGKTYYLVHSCPNDDIQRKMQDFKYDEDEIAKYVWERVNPMGRLEIDDKVVVAGHTIVQEYIGNKDEPRPVMDSDDIKKAHYIDIDGGLAANYKTSRLIALCLDDLSYTLY